jgi:hypothetical protein
MDNPFEVNPTKPEKLLFTTTLSFFSFFISLEIVVVSSCAFTVEMLNNKNAETSMNSC